MVVLVSFCETVEGDRRMLRGRRGVNTFLRQILTSGCGVYVSVSMLHLCAGMLLWMPFGIVLPIGRGIVTS